MSLSPLDIDRLQLALIVATSAIGVSEPNPRVGCVIGRSDGSLLGQGATQQVGGPHAEVVALRQAQASGHDLRGACVWVTLEPCAHHGRTPPCCDALIAAGVARVVVATTDPFPAVNGMGLACLRAAGIEVVMANSRIAAAARELNVGFFSRLMRQRPWVRLKVATSLDGRTALPDGRSQWITGPEARADGHEWRKRAGAVLTGLGTVVADNPRLDVRLVPTQVQPLRVVLDSQLRLQPDAAILAPPGHTLVATTQTSAAQAIRLRQAGAEVVPLPSVAGRVDLQALMNELTMRHVNELHVEAGARLNAALLQGGWVDELLLYQAPMLMGEGRGVVDWPALSDLQTAPRFVFGGVAQVGADLRITARRSSANPGDSFVEFLSGSL
jgi:diaminohydroxyphosphoribosylaminopyrimidine deaminase / 5-amino-6-(5-phosphoribosylamino)uracil reductase